MPGPARRRDEEAERTTNPPLDEPATQIVLVMAPVSAPWTSLAYLPSTPLV